jgi:hypothetical protein
MVNDAEESRRQREAQVRERLEKQRELERKWLADAKARNSGKDR